ncbi:MAG TPA: hypothetical protein VFO02_12940, partial [Burkholderiales bacterium]|nr:hypothetical protein [Burkholderiales bacterium]
GRVRNRNRRHNHVLEQARLGELLRRIDADLFVKDRGIGGKRFARSQGEQRSAPPTLFAGP